LSSSLSTHSFQFDREDLARALFHEAGDGLFLFDPESGRILAVNPVAQRLTRFNEAELLQMRASYLFRAESRGGMHRLRQASHQTGFFHSQEGYLLRTREEGSWTPVNLTIARLHLKEKTLGLVTVRDIREQRESLIRLEKMEAELRRVISSVSDCLWSAEVDASGEWNYRYFSPVVEKITGQPPRHWLGQPHRWRSLIHADDRRRWDRFVQRLRDGKSDQEEYRIYRDDRAIIWVRDRAQVRGGEGEPRHVAGVLTDITAEKSLEEQLRQSQKLEGIGRLAGGIAHDFNNLLTVIKGFSEMIQAGLGSGHPLLPAVQQVQKAADRGASLTGQLLAFSRRVPLQPRVFDVNTVLAETEKMLRRVIGEDIELLILPGRQLGWIKADPAQLDQILLNLAVNARDAMPHGGKLTIQTTSVVLTSESGRLPPDLPPGPYVLLAVHDTGQGMTPEVLEHIFEPFFTTKEFGKGTGLGLSIVYGIVKQHQGHIEAASQPGQGTTFRIYFPQTADRESLPAAVVRPKGGSRTGTETILLVEDEEMVRAVAATVLQQRGYHLLQARNGMEALRVARSHGRDIDLLVTDVIMPQMNGEQLYQQLSAGQPGLKVLYVSGYSDPVLGRYALSSDHLLLAKPFTAEHLLCKVRTLLDGLHS
jgi:PAS domain S-box-containing protein